jgi:hypothetical protein
MKTFFERNVNPLSVMRRIALTRLKVDSWGFKESYYSAQTGNLIFNSEWCRVNFIWGGWDQNGGNTMHIHYGRSHAANESEVMLWKGEECHCWHDIDHPLNFLDGLHPPDIVKQYYSHPITDPFYKDKIRKKFDRRQPEWTAEMHLAIWQHYGNRFFELFDIRQSDLWQRYQIFLKEFYDIKGRSLSINPPLDKVC